jgi:hypothetical protein
MIEMKAIFYAAGPDFNRKILKRIDNVDVALTITAVLAIDPPKDSQGEDSYRRQVGSSSPILTRIVICS